MKYLVIEQPVKACGDMMVEEYESKEKAIEAAKYLWNHLTNQEQKKYIVEAIESANPDEEAEDHLDAKEILVHYPMDTSED